MPDLFNYFVAYNLAEPAETAKGVTDEILTIGRAALLMPSLWYVRSSFKENVIRDRLRAKMTSHDQVLVVAASNALGFGLDVDLWQAVKKEWTTGFTAPVETARPEVTQ